jgi:hypothetical protein
MTFSGPAEPAVIDAGWAVGEVYSEVETITLSSVSCW